MSSISTWEGKVASPWAGSGSISSTLWRKTPIFSPMTRSNFLTRQPSPPKGLFSHSFQNYHYSTALNWPFLHFPISCQRGRFSHILWLSPVKCSYWPRLSVLPSPITFLWVTVITVKQPFYTVLWHQLIKTMWCRNNEKQEFTITFTTELFVTE